jgi:hypothetical protein
MDIDEYEEKISDYMEMIYQEGHRRFDVPDDEFLKPEQQNSAATLLMAAAILHMGHKQEQQHKLMIEALDKLGTGLEGLAHGIYDAIKEVYGDG